MFSKIYIEDVDVVRTCTRECRESLEGLEKEILKLEVRRDDIELLDIIFNKVRRIKRGASFAGLSGITEISREFELVLDAIRERKVSVGKELIDGLLLSTDFLNAYFTGLQESLTRSAILDENDRIYLEFNIEQNEEHVLKSLKMALNASEIRDHENSRILPEVDFDMLQSEDFKEGLSEGIREQFLFENTEHIEKIENDLLIRLDNNNEDREAISEVFRAVHTIKGCTGVYLAALSSQSPEYPGLRKFSEVVHAFENLLALVRDKGCNFGAKLIDISFSVMDYLKAVIQSVASEESVGLENIDILNGLREQISHIQSLADDIYQNTVAAPRQELEKAEDTKSKSSIIQSIRVNQDKIDSMMNTISELLIARNSFMHISTKLNLEYDLPDMAKEVKQVGAHINRISDELQNTIMSIRMVEIKTVFQRMPRVVRDIAQSTDKKIELHMEGENTEIDKTIIEQISDPLVHLIRNAADHGVESPRERLSKGKPETGKIVLRAYNKNKHVFIEIEDDGKGIDPEKMKEKAVEKGFITGTDAEKMSRNQLQNTVFLPGFSTAGQVTEISGRGVGMDIVKSNITKIKGNIMLESEVDKGTKVIIQLPLSLAVSRGLLVDVSEESYIIPLEYIIETVKLSRNSIHNYKGKSFTYFRGDVIRVEWLYRIFLMNDRGIDNEELNAVILSNGVEQYAIIVDKLRNEQEFVVKTLDGYLAAIPGISGSTLLGNGQVVLIVNPVDLLRLAEDGKTVYAYDEISEQS